MRHLRIYRSILLIVKEGSIRKAADTMAISPSALNRSIQAFESELGAEIFERVAGGVRLSVAGELIVRPISEHLAQMDDFLGTISELKGGTSGRLHLCVSDDLWPGLAGTIVRQFRAKHPSIALEISRSNDLEPLRLRRVDLALTTLPELGDDLRTLVSARLPMEACVSEASRLGLEGWIDVSDLPDMTLLVPPDDTGTRREIDLALHQIPMAPAGRSVLPGTPDTLQSGPKADLFFAPRPIETVWPDGARKVDISRLRISEVQVALVARRSGHLGRIAERFAVVAGAVFDGIDHS